MKKFLRLSLTSYGLFSSIKNVRVLSTKIVNPSSVDCQDQKLEKFKSYFSKLSQHLAKDPDTPDLHFFLSEHFSSLANYTIPGGKMNRGLSVPQSYQLLVHQPDPADMELANVLGWSVEILQAFYLVADDIMDGSVTRQENEIFSQPSDVNYFQERKAVLASTIWHWPVSFQR